VTTVFLLACCRVFPLGDTWFGLKKFYKGGNFTFGLAWIDVLGWNGVLGWIVLMALRLKSSLLRPVAS
jgi:hypothetical protein